MKQKTAIRQLIEYVSLYDSISNPVIIDILRIAKSLEPVNEQQIVDAYDAGVKTQHGIQTSDVKHGEKYFNQTFEKP
jgi:hypothetical protein